MLKRLTLGDVFEVPLSHSQKGYLQYVGKDLTQLNMEVLRVFAGRYDTKIHATLENVLSGEVDFFVHVVSTKKGENTGLWQKIGNSEDIGDLKQVLFRDTLDWGQLSENSVSTRWHVWHIDGEWQKVSLNKKLLSKAHVGLGFWPQDIVTRMRTGKYPIYKYPSFEGEKKRTTM